MSERASERASERVSGGLMHQRGSDQALSTTSLSQSQNPRYNCYAPERIKFGFTDLAQLI